MFVRREEEEEEEVVEDDGGSGEIQEKNLMRGNEKNKKKTFHTFVCLLIMMFSHVTHMYPLKVEGRGLKFRSVPPLKVKENVIYIERE